MIWLSYSWALGGEGGKRKRPTILSLISLFIIAAAVVVIAVFAPLDSDFMGIRVWFVFLDTSYPKQAYL